MKRFLRFCRKTFRYGEKGFTLIELLIVVAVLGALAAVVVPNVGSFLGTANKAAANTEVQNVKTAAMAYLADNGAFPAHSDNLTPSYISAAPDGDYAISTTTGLITGGTAGSGITSAFTFSVANQQWE